VPKLYALVFLFGMSGAFTKYRDVVPTLNEPDG
jgi:hypothetical protein